MNLEQTLKDLEATIIELGHYQMQGWQQLHEDQVQRKRDSNGEESIVTTYDIESEHRLRQFIESKFPDHSFLGEETGHLQRDPEHYWIVDPIDGTTNFTHSIPFWGPSVAYWHKGQPELAVIHFPALSQTYSARRGAGAFCNGQRIQTSRDRDYSMQNIVALHSRTHLQKLGKVRTKLRIPGSIIANICLMARGSFVASTGRGRLWDIAAGVLLLAEAGACFEVIPSITDFDVVAYAEHPEKAEVFQLFAQANEHVPALRHLLHG